MDGVKTIVWVVMILAALVMIVLILMQHGKGADAGAAFGSGSAQGVFGASGSANFLSRATGWCAIFFISACLFLAWTATQKNKSVLGLEDGKAVATQSQPAVTASGTAVGNTQDRPAVASSVIPE